MQKTACSEDIFFDLPAYVALLRSFDFWRIYDFYKNDRKAYLFSQIIMNPKFFSETDKVIADALFICEKSVQNYRREFKEVFSDEYEYAKTLDTDTSACHPKHIADIAWNRRLPLFYQKRSAGLP